MLTLGLKACYFGLVGSPGQDKGQKWVRTFRGTALAPLESRSAPCVSVARRPCLGDTKPLDRSHNTSQVGSVELGSSIPYSSHQALSTSRLNKADGTSRELPHDATKLIWVAGRNSGSITRIQIFWQFILDFLSSHPVIGVVWETDNLKATLLS